MTDPARPIGRLYRAAARQLMLLLADKARASLSGPTPDVSYTAELDVQRRTAAIVGVLAARADQAARKAVTDAAEQGQREAARQTRGKPTTMPPGGVLERDRIADDLAGRLRPVHAQILRATPDMYRQVVADAMLAPPITGNPELDRLHRAQRALNRFADAGVVDMVDEHGRRWNITSYVEMATRTAATRAQVAAYTQRLTDSGVSLVVVSDHRGACPLCEPWEGRVLRLRPSPVAQTVHALDADGVSRRMQVAGTLGEAVTAGLFHPNCSHHLTAYTGPQTVIPRVQRDPDVYQAEQRLRAMERHVRMWRMREAGALTAQTRTAAEARRKGWQHAIAEHAARTGVARRRDREQITAAR